MSIYYDKTDHFNALQNYLNTRGKIVNGEGFYFVNGEWIPDKEYFAHNSRPTYSPPVKANADGTSIAPDTIRKKST